MECLYFNKLLNYNHVQSVSNLVIYTIFQTNLLNKFKILMMTSVKSKSHFNFVIISIIWNYKNVWFNLDYQYVYICHGIHRNVNKHLIVIYNTPKRFKNILNHYKLTYSMVYREIYNTTLIGFEGKQVITTSRIDTPTSYLKSLHDRHTVEQCSTTVTRINSYTCSKNKTKIECNLNVE